MTILCPQRKHCDKLILVCQVETFTPRTPPRVLVAGVAVLRFALNDNASQFPLVGVLGV
jgi:hypothetical protein